MLGLVLTGPLGVGKTTAQAALVRDHSFWQPVTHTTRGLEEGESEAVSLSVPEFILGVKSGSLVLPSNFGGHWYGWRLEDLVRLRTAPGRAVLNVRPYAAILLETFLDNFVAVWLDLSPTLLRERRGRRNARRDTNSTTARRLALDAEDMAYRECFTHFAYADSRLLENLLELVP